MALIPMEMKQEIPDKWTWHLAGETLGNTAIAIPAADTDNWNELCFVLRYGTSSGLQSQCLNIIVPRSAVNISTSLVYTAGSGTILGQAYVTYTSNTFKGQMIAFQIEGTSYLSTSKCYLYYR